MPVVLGDEQWLVPGNCLFGLTAGIVPGVGKIVVGVHILHGAALF